MIKHNKGAEEYITTVLLSLHQSQVQGNKNTSAVLQWKKKKNIITGCFSPAGHSVLLPWIQTLLFYEPEIVYNYSKTTIWAYTVVLMKISDWLLFFYTFLEIISYKQRCVILR